MDSKELNEILNKTRRTPDISLTPKQVEEIIKDLEELEEYRKIMGTPIQDIMKKLKVLDILKKSLKVIEEELDDDDKSKWEHLIFEEWELNDNEEKLIKEYLENEK